MSRKEVLSKHVRVLHEAGYLDVHKSTSASRVRTSLSLTRAGRVAYDGHLAALRAIVTNEAFDASALYRGIPAGQGPPAARPMTSSRTMLYRRSVPQISWQTTVARSRRRTWLKTRRVRRLRHPRPAA